MPGLGAFALLDADASAMDERLWRRPTRAEFFALALALGVLVIFLWLDASQGYIPFDYHIYIKTARRNLVQFYYADWILPLFWLWSRMPPLLGFALWSLVNTLSLFFAARLFGGRSALVLLTFPFFYSLFQGQINGLLAGALALAWWALAHRRWHLAGFAFWLAGAKFQVGLPLGFLLWLAAEADWRSRLRVLMLPFLLTLAVFVIFPDWVSHLVDRVRAVAPYDWGSISLWRSLGPAALSFLLPPLLLPMDKGRRILALAAAAPLALPYFQSADLLVLFVLPVGVVPLLLSELGFLFFRCQFAVLRLLWIVPLYIYLSILLPTVWVWIRNRRSPGGPTPQP